MKLSFVLGTRPEVIKLAPVILAARKRGHEASVVLTGQHREMARSLLKLFELEPNIDLDVMTPGQTLTSLSSRILEKLDEHSERVKSDVLVVQGDTTSAFVAAFWGFCKGIPVAHVEAGLRTYDLSAPFPEEANRQLIGRIARFHFAPTQGAIQALKKENVPAKQLFLVGNTGVDALLHVLKPLKAKKNLLSRFSEFLANHPLVLITAHRRENFGKPFEDICQGILTLAEKRPDLRFIYPVHPNPNVKNTAEARLGNHPRILLCEPLSYPNFVLLMDRAKILLTDSGGVQEEAPSLRKPILVLRNETERPEGVKRGFATLVGTDSKKIVTESIRALKTGCRGRGKNPYGDGKASERIIRTLERALKPNAGRSKA